jgi:ethanolamine utilization protein EutN
MYLARVVGTVVATQKVDGLDGVRLLVVEPVGDDGQPVGAQAVAVDAVSVGPGELVYVCTGREASLALDETFVPVDLAVVGHVDEVTAVAEGAPRTARRGGE